MQLKEYIRQRWLSKYLSEVITNYPLRFIAISLLIIAALLPGLSKLQSEFSHEVWFRPGDPYLETFNNFKKEFGMDDLIILAIHSETGLFEKGKIETLQKITEEMLLVPTMIRVESLANFNWVHAEDDNIIVEDFFPEELNDEIVNHRKNLIPSLDGPKRFLISDDLKTTVMYGRPKPTFVGKPEYSELISGVRKLAAKYKNSHDFKYYVSGSISMSEGLKEMTVQDLSTIIPIVLIAIVVLLGLIFQSFLGVMIPLGLIFITVPCALGAAGWIGAKINMTTSMLPCILMAICIADSIHILISFSKFRPESKDVKETLRKTLFKNIQPTLLTSISTSIGFYSLTLTDLVPIRELGILAGSGTFIAWILSIFLLSPLLLYLPFGNKQVDESSSGMVNTKKCLDLVHKYKFYICVFFLFFSLLSIYFTSKNKINSTTIDYFLDQSETKIAYEFTRKHIGGTYGIEMVIDSGERDGIYDPAFLKKVDKFQTWINQLPHVTKSSSLLDIIKDVNRSLNSNKQEFYSIPDSREAVAQELLLYSLGLPADMSMTHWNTLDNKRMRVSVMWLHKGTEQTLKGVKEFEDKIKSTDLDIKITGVNSLVTGLNDYIVKTFFVSMITALTLVTLLMTVFFGSIKLGLLSMVPNIIPPILGSGLMYILGIDIDVSTILITSVCLGIAVDDTIYFLSDYNRLKSENKSNKQAIQEIYNKTGKSLVFTTLILVTGFCCFTLGNFQPNINFGIITSFVLTMALVTDLILLPALLLLPKGSDQ